MNTKTATLREKQNLNLERYHDAIGFDSETLYNRFNRWYFKKFHSLFELEFTFHHEQYFKMTEKSYCLSDEALKYLDSINPTEVHKFLYSPMIFTTAIHSWLCCGRRVFNKETNLLELNDKVHMLSKLCRYTTWENVKITWWDRIRFFLITEHRFVK